MRTSTSFSFTIPRGMLSDAFREGAISFLLVCDVEGEPVRAAVRFATREHPDPGARPRLVFGRGELLYNGIRLPAQWPPRAKDLPDDPVTPPYLVVPPELIPIDMGRQLLVDDFLVAKTTLKRTFHLPQYRL